MRKKQTGTRINKYLADQGLSTRKSADNLVTSGLVLINNKPAKIGQNVQPTDKVTILNQEKLNQNYQYYIYNKPKNVVTIGAQGSEREILDLVKLPNGFLPVGRLDKDSSGIIVLTNDRRVTNRLLSPKYSHEKEYVVDVNKDITNGLLVGLKKGISLGYKEKTKPALARKIGPRRFEIILTEGKNRQIRRMCKAFNFEVVNLKRFRIMNLTNAGLRVGELREIVGKNKDKFLKELGLI